MKKLIFFALIFISTILRTHSQSSPVGLAAGEVAPLFTAKDQAGKSLSLKQLLTNGPVVLIFYRGYWCPYCNTYLSKLQDSLLLLTSKGASVVAVSPEIMENVDKTIKKTRSTFAVISDEEMKIMKAYKVNFEVDKETVQRYKSYNIDFNKENGTNGANLPIPATYIISKEGKIIYRFFESDYTKRPTVKSLLSQLP